jgi:hypothetical protein
MTDAPADIARRTALKLVAAAGAGLAASAGTAKAAIAPVAPKLDLMTPAGLLRAFILMRGALDERLVIGCVQGRYYGVVDDVLTPLYGVNAATFARYKRMPDGGYEAATCEQAYFTSLETGQVLENWVNPYTGETVTVPVTASKPQHIRIDKNMQFDLPAIPGMSAKHDILPIETIGNDIWFTEQTFVTLGKPGDKPYHYNELTTLHARRSDLGLASAKRVPCETHFSATVSWRPWLNMGDRPGHMLGNGGGLYGATMETLSPVWMEATLKARPELVHDTLGVLDPVWKTIGAGKAVP